ncbi:acyltransferase [Devriesea agamarum]|uniref:acyltransferase n=1 Tax=Devriesea agamarum TaxID=472569 RepID=UPI00071D28F1|nr:DapH/DapD/GlmU-related protein [Devriesea agamarum]
MGMGLGTRLRKAMFPLVMSDSVHGRHRWKLLKMLGVHGMESCFIQQRCIFRGFSTRIGEGSYINYGVYFDDNAPVILGRNVGVGPMTKFITASHRLGPSEHRISGGFAGGPIVVEDGCWIGANVTVLPNVTIGRGCVIGAGAVVTRDCEPDGLYVGVPARRIRDLDVEPKP